jgi:hypothetical protein
MVGVYGATLIQRPTVADPRQQVEREERRRLGMGWYIGGGVLYIVLLVTLGIITIRNGHWVLFLFGLIFPLLWLIGAIIRPVARAR